MPWLQRDLILQNPGSDSSSCFDMKYLGCGITPSSRYLGNPIIIIITLLLNFLTSSWILFQPELCNLFSLSHHLVVTNEKERREMLISIQHQNALPMVVTFHSNLTVSLSNITADTPRACQGLRDLFRMKMRWGNLHLCRYLLHSAPSKVHRHSATYPR